MCLAKSIPKNVHFLPIVVVSLSGSLPRPASELLSDTLSSWSEETARVNSYIKKNDDKKISLAAQIQLLNLSSLTFSVFLL